MIYPAPTAPLHPERSTRPVPLHAPRTVSAEGFTVYPPQTTGVGIPIKFVAISPVQINAGENYQLVPAMVDIQGNLQTPRERLRYTSNNPKILVSDSGLIVTNVPATVYSRRGSAETATIQIGHADIDTFVSVIVRTDVTDLVSD